MKKVEVYFVRHGQTLFNLLDKIQGWADSPLTDEGINKLEKTAQALKDVHFDALYSSDLKRAMDTAEIVNRANRSELTLKTLIDLREVFYGMFEGFSATGTWKEIASEYGLTTQTEVINKLGANGARDAVKKADPRSLSEDSSALNSRINSAFQTILEENENNSRILVVGHGAYLKHLVINHWDESEGRDVAFPENGSVTKIEVTEEGLQIKEFNIKNDTVF